MYHSFWDTLYIHTYIRIFIYRYFIKIIAFLGYIDIFSHFVATFPLDAGLSEDSDYTSDINVPLNSNNSPRHSRNGHRDDDDLPPLSHHDYPDHDDYELEPYDQEQVNNQVYRIRISFLSNRKSLLVGLFSKYVHSPLWLAHDKEQKEEKSYSYIHYVWYYDISVKSNGKLICMCWSKCFQISHQCSNPERG